MAVNINKNAMLNTIKSVFSIIYPLITFPYISRVLKAENLGKINFSSSIISYFSLIASLGVATYAIRECAKVREDRQKLSETASQIFSINILSTLISYFMLAVMLIIAKPLENYRVVIGIQSCSIVFSTLGADWLNTAMEDFSYITYRTVSMQCISLLLMFFFVKEPSHYVRYAIISVIASSGANIANIFYRKKYCKIKLTLHMELKKHISPILLLFSMILSQTIYCNSDITMLGLIKGDVDVGLYSTAVKIYNLINTLIASVAWVVMPKLALNFAKENYTEINKLLKYSLNFIIVLGLPCLVGINIVATELIETLAGVEYLGALTSLHILSISLAFSFLGGWIGNMMMLPSGRERVCLRSSVICAIINVLLNLVMIPIWGLNAAATTTALAEFIGIITKAPYIDKKIKIDGVPEMMKAPLIGSLGIIVVALFARVVFDSAIVILCVTIVISIVFYGIVLVVLENEFAMNFVGVFISKFSKYRGEIS